LADACLGKPFQPEQQLACDIQSKAKDPAISPSSTVSASEELVEELNVVLKGWGNYFRLGSVSQAYRSVDSHVCDRLRRWLSKKHQLNTSGHKRFSDQYLKERLGLFSLAGWDNKNRPAIATRINSLSSLGGVKCIPRIFMTVNSCFGRGRG
jgi:Group II intron, maturase-specific domain